MTSALTYVYCVVRSARQPAQRGLRSGMPGSGPIRALDAGDGLWLIVSSVPAREYNEDAVARGLRNLEWVGRRAIAHEAVVERFLSAPAILPMQLFTLFTSDERAIEHVLADHRRISRILRRVEGHHEWGLRLTWDEKSAKETVERRHRPARGKSAVSGAAYLARKRDVLDLNRERLREARAAANRLYRATARDATEARRRTTLERAAPGSRLLLDAAFLVPTRRARAFREGVRRNARTFAGSPLLVSLTGPWPPYNFI